MRDQQIRLSVRQLVEFALKSGSLDDSYTGINRAVLGTRAHQKHQKQLKQQLGDRYITEYSLSYPIEKDGIHFLIEGRADGIITEEDGVTLDEIKSTYCALGLIGEDFNPVHWAQAKVYAYIYARQSGLSHITVQLTYFNLDTEEHKVLAKAFELEELNAFFEEILQKLWNWFAFVQRHLTERDEALQALQFPFDSYRKNQREFAVAVYKTIAEGSSIFAQAPTGTGKTISTMFPALKALGEGHITKIFYLTAKTITRQVAEDTIRLLLEKGLKVNAVVLTAKDKACFEKESSCRGDSCVYAEGYFDRIDDALYDILKHEALINRSVIEEYAVKHRVCPFEFSLDISLWTDMVICDYNYVFDPRAYLKRFFGDANEGNTDRQYALLIDEAHNLVDRSRDMYSAGISKALILEQKRVFKGLNKELYQQLTEVNKYFIEVKKNAEAKELVSKEAPKELYSLLKKLAAAFETVQQLQPQLMREESLTLYFDTLFFLKIYELFDDNYACITEIGRDVTTKLFCIDASRLLQEKIKKAKAAVFFSATLLPMNYYVYMLGGTEASYTMRIPSSFPRENLGLYVVKDISTKFRNRENSIRQVAACIHSAVRHRIGNYMIYCSSYSYMQDILREFEEQHKDYDILVQSQAMGEEEKEAFLQSFQPDNPKTLLGFAVMGGIFSEGIDLRGDRLSGVIIVGVGLPLLCLERDVIKVHFEEQKGAGFDYAYKFPGMNKVQQAAGRVIRSETDRGIVVLIDERFDQISYRRLFPQEWEGAVFLKGLDELEDHMIFFWENSK